MRNADHDLKICNAATRGPWEYDGMHNEILTPHGDDRWLIISECRSAPDQKYPIDPFGHKYDANFAFIALAREALPYWIKRAQELEKVLRWYEQWEADLLMDDQAWSSGLPRFTQSLQDKWIKLQEQRNKALRKEKSENDSAKR